RFRPRPPAGLARPVPAGGARLVPRRTRPAGRPSPCPVPTLSVGSPCRTGPPAALPGACRPPARGPLPGPPPPAAAAPVRGRPLGEQEEEGWHKIRIIGDEQLFIDRVRELLPEDEDYKYEVAHSGFEAGIQAESFHPDTIIVDLAMGRSEALQIAQNLRRNPQYEQTLIIALASEDEAAPETLVNYGFSEAFKKPFDVGRASCRERTLVDAKRDSM